MHLVLTATEEITLAGQTTTYVFLTNKYIYADLALNVQTQQQEQKYFR